MKRNITLLLTGIIIGTALGATAISIEYIITGLYGTY